MPFLGKNPTSGFSTIVKDDLTPDGSTTDFTLSKNVASANDIAVFVGNVRQEPTDAYSVSGTTLTMTAAPASGINFYVLHIAGTLESSVIPADNTISTAKLQSSAVTDAKIAADAVTTAKIADNNVTSAKLSSTLDLSSKTVSLGAAPMKPIFWAQKTSDQTLSRGTVTKLTGFGTNEIDTNSAFDGTTFTVPAGLGGTYVFQASVFFDWSNAGNDGEHYYFYFYINGSQRARIGQSMASGGRHFSQTMVTGIELASLSVGDTVELYGYMVDDSASGTMSVLGGSSYGCQFGAFRIG
jgi:hypothetical protein